MRVLVTGSNGFLGAAIVRQLCERGGATEIRCLHRPGSDVGRIDALRTAFPAVRLETLAGNLVSREDCTRAVEGVDVVLHSAAAMKGAAADMFLNTVVATRNLLDAVVASPSRPRVVLVSSFGVYGTTAMREGAVLTEDSPLEPHPELRDVYSHAKLRQEQLCWEYHRDRGVRLTVLRPGVIYGPSGPLISSRVGLRVFGLYLHLGRRNLLPLTYVDSCASAIVTAGLHPDAEGQAYNVVDDGLPTARAYLSRYRREVERLRVLSLPLWVTRLLARAIEWYHRRSRGQLPAVITRYKADSAWRSFRFDNAKLKGLGWAPSVTVDEGLRRTFAPARPAR